MKTPTITRTGRHFATGKHYADCGGVTGWGSTVKQAKRRAFRLWLKQNTRGLAVCD